MKGGGRLRESEKNDGSRMGERVECMTVGRREIDEARVREVEGVIVGGRGKRKEGVINLNRGEQEEK